MNILFINYGDFTSNSLNHIGSFANELIRRGHACAVAVPENPETLSVVHGPMFNAVTFARALEAEPIFPDRRPADIVHAWTPREIVREFALTYLHRHPTAALIIHLEDNEVTLMESFARETYAKLRTLSDEELTARLSPRLSHPIRFRNFLKTAHGITYITGRLREFIPTGKPSHLLQPGVDTSIYHPRPADQARRIKIGVRPDEKLIVFTGSTTFVNLADVRTLILAVRLLNERGIPCKLVRTGINPPHLEATLAPMEGGHVIDLGFIEKTELGPLLALADVLVQPGAADSFNDYRLPSKIPEFLCAGRPVVMPQANIGHAMEDGLHALLLKTGTAEEIAGHCQRIFSDAALARRLSKGAVTFTQMHFDLAKNTAGLLAFYEQVGAAAPPLFSDPLMPPTEDVLVTTGDDALRMRAKELSLHALRLQQNALSAEISRLGVTMAQKEAEAAQQLAAELQRRETEAARQGTELAELRDSLAAEKTRAAEISGASQQLTAELQRREAEAARQGAELAELRDSLAAEKARSAELSNASQQLAAALQRREAEATRHLAESATLRATLAAEKTRAADLASSSQQLTLELTEARDCIQQLDAEKKQADENLRLLQAEQSYQKARRQSDWHSIELLRRQLTEASEGMARLTREIETERERAENANRELAVRNDKIRRMAGSFSWQATSPLRALRRVLLDPVKKSAEPSPQALPEPDVDTRFIHTIDEPSGTEAMLPSGTLRGWVIGPDRSPIMAVRAKFNGEVKSVPYGLPRPDVASSHPDQPHAAHCGFRLAYDLPPLSQQSIVIEAQSEDGIWRCFARLSGKIAAEIPLEQRRDYATWVQRFDTLDREKTLRLRAAIEALPPAQRPLISVVMPVYNTPEQWLVKAIESVRAQVYPHWELCIADDASTAPHVRKVLADFAAQDSRIKVDYRRANGHICAASNSALALATGEWIALLDHDDELAPQALAEIALALSRCPGLDFIYTDEDKINECGLRFDPYFKPDWNPDLLLGQNYTCHLSVFRAKCLRDIGGFIEGFEGSQDWDVTLRVTTGLDPARIHHIPKILYHWRAIAGSTAHAVDAKADYPSLTARKALAEHMARTGIQGELLPVEGRHWRIKRALPAVPPKVSIIIPTHNAVGLLKTTIGSILEKSTYPDFEIIVVDNRSDDPATLAYLDEIRRRGIRVVDYAARFNFSAINNFAARAAHGSVLAFLNNDIEVITPEWLEEMVSHALRPEIGAVGAMLYYPDGSVQHAGVVLGITGPALRDGVAGHALKRSPRGSAGDKNRLRLVQNYSAVTAACLVVERSVFGEVGGFDESDLAVAFNDVDLCLRIRATGRRNLWTPFAEFLHHESATRGAENTPEKAARFNREVAHMRQRWAHLLDNDPSYNPNLTIIEENFALAFPPRIRAV